MSYTLNTIDWPAIAFKPMQSADAHGVGASESAAPTLAAQPGGNAVPAVCYPEVFHTLTAKNAGNVESAQRANCVCYGTTQITSPMNYSNPKNGDPCHPLAEQQHPPLVVYDARGNGNGTGCQTLTGDHERRVTDYTTIVCMATGQGGA